MGKTHGAAAGAVMSLLDTARVPWIVGGALAVLGLLLALATALAFCPRVEPTRRVIALVQAVKSPSSPPARRNHRRAKPSDQS